MEVCIPFSPPLAMHLIFDQTLILLTSPLSLMFAPSLSPLLPQGYFMTKSLRPNVPSSHSTPPLPPPSPPPQGLLYDQDLPPQRLSGRGDLRQRAEEGLVAGGWDQVRIRVG